MPSKQHEETIRQKTNELKNEGWHVVILNGKVPDAIAVKDNMIVAIEVLPKKDIMRQPDWYNKAYRKMYDGQTYTMAMKRVNYKMFDGIMFFGY